MIESMSVAESPPGRSVRPIDPAKSGYTKPRTAAFFQELLRRLRLRENIEAAGLASHGTLSGVLPVGTRFMSTQMHADGVVEAVGLDGAFTALTAWRLAGHQARRMRAALG